MHECVHNWIKTNERPKIEKEWVVNSNDEKVEVYYNVYQCSKCNLKREMPENEISASTFEEGTLDKMINSLVDFDSFWALTIKKFFDSLTISLDEKIIFLTKLANNKDIFNEFTKELVKDYNSNTLYEKYLNLNQINLEKEYNDRITLKKGEVTFISPEELQQKINIKYSTFETNLKNTNISICPNCSERLSKLMPDGAIFSCNKCGKYYKNDNGKVGNETSSPYIDNTILY